MLVLRSLHCACMLHVVCSGAGIGRCRRATHSTSALRRRVRAVAAGRRPGAISASLVLGAFLTSNVHCAAQARLSEMQRLDVERSEIVRAFRREQRALQLRYERLYSPIYERRARLVDGTSARAGAPVAAAGAHRAAPAGCSGVPGFWLRALKNHYELAEQIWPQACATTPNTNQTHFGSAAKAESPFVSPRFGVATVVRFHRCLVAVACTRVPTSDLWSLQSASF